MVAVIAVVALVAAAYTSLQPATPAASPTPGAISTAGSSAAPSAPSAPPSPASPTPSAPPSEPPPPETDPYPCGEADPTCLSLDVQMTRDIDVTGPVPCGGDAACLLKVDSFALPGGTGRPVVVMIPGGPLPPGNRTYLWNLARIVAGRGAVVFTADYRSSPAYGGGYPATFGDVACAIRFARERAPKLGGDPSRVTLVAHSFGGFPGAVLALSATDYAAKAQGCLTTTGDGRPDAFVGIAGVYSLDRIGQAFLTDFFGGDRATAPTAWDAGDVAVLAGLKGHRTPPVRLVTGTGDLVAPPATQEAFATILRAAKYDVTATVVDGATHDTVLYKAVAVDAILNAAAAAAAR